MGGERVELQIDALCNVKQGRYLAPKEMADTPNSAKKIPVYGANGILGFTDKVKYEEPVTLVTCRGSNCGLIQRTDGAAWISNNAMACPPKSGFDSLYIHYVLLNSDFDDVTTGSAQPQITTGHLNTKPLLVTEDDSEQKAIASILGALDDKIELNRRMNETLESMARAIFKSWFVDFDPVRAKMEGQHPAGMNPETAALFPDSFEEQDGEMIPKGWMETTLGEEADFKTGFAFKSKFFSEEPPGIRLARGMNVKEGEFFWSSQARYWPEVTSEIEEYLLDAGDVLIGMDGSKVGKNWVRVRAADLPCLLVQRVARLRAASSIGENFIWILVGSSTFRYYVDAVKTGTSIPHISGGQIKKYHFMRPAREDNRIFEHFESLASPMTKQTDKNHAESQTLANLRDTLLPKLLSGELRVPEAEKQVEGVV